MKNQGGFSLVEVLISVFLLGMVGSALLAGLGTVSETTPLANQKSTALSIAEAQMEYIYNQDYDDINNPPAYQVLPNLPPEYSIDVPMVERLDPDGDGLADDDGLQRVRVVIRYDDESIASLQGYKSSN